MLHPFQNVQRWTKENKIKFRIQSPAGKNCPYKCGMWISLKIETTSTSAIVPDAQILCKLIVFSQVRTLIIARMEYRAPGAHSRYKQNPSVPFASILKIFTFEIVAVVEMVRFPKPTTESVMRACLGALVRIEQKVFGKFKSTLFVCRFVG